MTEKKSGYHWTEEELESMGKDILEAVKDEKFMFSNFARSRGLKADSLPAIAKRHPIFAKYFHDARSIFHKRRERIPVTGRPLKYSDAEIEKLGKELITTVKQDGVWHITEFSELHEKTEFWLYSLRDNYPVFAQYLTRAHRILGRKMYEYGMEKNPNAWMLKTFMPRLLNARKEVHEELRDEVTIKAEATRDAIAKDPDHPFWKTFEQYMKEDDDKSAK